MGQMTYAQIRRALADFSAEKVVAGQPFETTVLWDENDAWAGAWANIDMYVLVAAAWFPDNPITTIIDIHAGGGYGLTGSEELFENLCHASLRLDGGAPWVRRQFDGSVAFGWQQRLQSQFFFEENYGVAFGLIEGAIWSFGRVALEMANELIPRHGGYPLRADSPNSLPIMSTGLVPIQGPSARPLH